MKISKAANNKCKSKVERILAAVNAGKFHPSKYEDETVRSIGGQLTNGWLLTPAQEIFVKSLFKKVADVCSLKLTGLTDANNFIQKKLSFHDVGPATGRIPCDKPNLTQGDYEATTAQNDHDSLDHYIGSPDEL